MKTFRKLVFLLCIYGQIKSFTASSNSSESAETEDSENTFIQNGNRKYHFVKNNTTFYNNGLNVCYNLDANIWTIRRSDNLEWLFSNLVEDSSSIWLPVIRTLNEQHLMTIEYAHLSTNTAHGQEISFRTGERGFDITA